MSVPDAGSNKKPISLSLPETIQAYVAKEEKAGQLTDQTGDLQGRVITVGPKGFRIKDVEATTGFLAAFKSSKPLSEYMSSTRLFRRKGMVKRMANAAIKAAGQAPTQGNEPKDRAITQLTARAIAEISNGISGVVQKCRNAEDRTHIDNYLPRGAEVTAYYEGIVNELYSTILKQELVGEAGSLVKKAQNLIEQSENHLKNLSQNPGGGVVVFTDLDAIDSLFEEFSYFAQKGHDLTEFPSDSTLLSESQVNPNIPLESPFSILGDDYERPTFMPHEPQDGLISETINVDILMYSTLLELNRCKERMVEIKQEIEQAGEKMEEKNKEIKTKQEPQVPPRQAAKPSTSE